MKLKLVFLLAVACMLLLALQGIASPISWYDGR